MTSPLHQYERWFPLDPLAIKAQMVLYRYAWSLDYVKQPAIADLHAYLFWNRPSITKRRMGEQATKTTTYTARILKGQTYENPRACMTYRFKRAEDLGYGLEWQMCLWSWILAGQDPDSNRKYFNELREYSDEDIDEDVRFLFHDSDHRQWILDRAALSFSSLGLETASQSHGPRATQPPLRSVGRT